MTTPTHPKAETDALLQDTSASALDYLERSLPILEEHLALMRSGQPEQGAKVLGEAADGIEWLVEYIALAAQATEATNAVVSVQFSALGVKMKEVIRLIVEAMTAKDNLLLADVLEFELIITLRDLRTLLASADLRAG